MGKIEKKMLYLKKWLNFPDESSKARKGYQHNVVFQDSLSGSLKFLMEFGKRCKYL